MEAMKTRFPAAACALLALLVIGCLPSVHPFYTADDVFFDEKLIGSFADGESKTEKDETWRFMKADDNRYQLEISVAKGEPGKIEVVGQLQGRLFKLGKHTCLDLSPDMDLLQDNFSGWYSSGFIPGHLIFKVHGVDDSGLVMSAPEYDWIGDFLKKNPDSLAHRTENDRLVLIAPTKKLRRFFLEHEGEIWAEPGKMIRQK